MSSCRRDSPRKCTAKKSKLYKKEQCRRAVYARRHFYEKICKTRQKAGKNQKNRVKSAKNRQFLKNCVAFYNSPMERMIYARTMAPTEMNLIRILREGPDVSLNGSPPVSPMTAAMCAVLPFPPKYPSSTYFSRCPTCHRLKP